MKVGLHTSSGRGLRAREVFMLLGTMSSALPLRDAPESQDSECWSRDVELPEAHVVLSSCTDVRVREACDRFPALWI